MLKRKSEDSIKAQIKALRRELHSMEEDREPRRGGRKKKKGGLPFSYKRILDQSLKEPKKIPVFMINIKGQIEKPRLVPILDGNMVMVKGRYYEVDPRAILGLQKYRVMVIKEIDRRPVSNLDYDEIRRRGDATDSDEFLIKAVSSAKIMPKPLAGVNKTVLIVIGVIVIGLIIFMASRGGGG